MRSRRRIEDAGLAVTENELHSPTATLSVKLRFNELKRKTGANSQTLSRVLDDLEALGFVKRRVEADGPVAIYYALTQKGADLQPLFEDVKEWAEEWIEDT